MNAQKNEERIEKFKVEENEFLVIKTLIRKRHSSLRKIRDMSCMWKTVLAIQIFFGTSIVCSKRGSDPLCDHKAQEKKAWRKLDSVPRGQAKKTWAKLSFKKRTPKTWEKQKNFLMSLSIDKKYKNRAGHSRICDGNLKKHSRNFWLKNLFWKIFAFINWIYWRREFHWKQDQSKYFWLLTFNWFCSSLQLKVPDMLISKMCSNTFIILPSNKLPIIFSWLDLYCKDTFIMFVLLSMD